MRVQNVLDRVPWNRFFIFQLFLIRNASSKGVNCGCWFDDLQALVPDHSDSLDITQPFCLSFPLLYSFKLVLTFSYQQASLLMAPSHPSNELCAHSGHHLGTSQHPAPAPHPASSSKGSSRFPDGYGAGTVQSCASILILFSHLVPFLCPWLCKCTVGTLQELPKRAPGNLSLPCILLDVGTRRSSMDAWH